MSGEENQKAWKPCKNLGPKEKNKGKKYQILRSQCGSNDAAQTTTLGEI